jgi:cystathionine beta-lyase/cystathionine gamma-synthase
MSAVQCEQLGITENLVRVSTGVEEVDDILADLGQALEQIS